MARLEMSNEQVRSALFKISSLGQSEREQVAGLIDRLSEAWFPDALRRELHKLQSAGTISEVDRHAVEKAFFPDHTW